MAKAFQSTGALTSLFGAPLTEFAIAFGSNVALVLTLYVGWKILTALELPAGPAVLLLTLFGTPLFYYTVFQPAYKHAVDALFVTLLTFLVLRISEQPTRRLLLLLGACIAFSVIVRYVNVALIPGALLPLLLRRQFRHTRLVLVSAAAGVALLLALPELRGLDLSRARHQDASAPVVQTAGIGGFVVDRLCADEPVEVNLEQCLRNTFGIDVDAAAPAKMLFTVKRGLFLWTPLTAFAVLGMILLIRSRPERRPLLLGISLAAALLLVAHAFWGEFWTGGFSFSQRFLAGLFPFFLLGTAELVRRWRGAAVAVLALCAAFSVFVAFNLAIGYEGVSEHDGLDTILELYTNGERTPGGLGRTIGVRALERWGLH